MMPAIRGSKLTFSGELKFPEGIFGYVSNSFHKSDITGENQRDER